MINFYCPRTSNLFGCPAIDIEMTRDTHNCPEIPLSIKKYVEDYSEKMFNSKFTLYKDTPSLASIDNKYDVHLYFKFMGRVQFTENFRFNQIRLKNNVVIPFNEVFREDLSGLVCIQFSQGDIQQMIVADEQDFEIECEDRNSGNAFIIHVSKWLNVRQAYGT